MALLCFWKHLHGKAIACTLEIKELILFIAGWISWIKLWQTDPYAISLRYIHTHPVSSSSSLLCTNCLLLNLACQAVRQIHKKTYVVLSRCIGYLADTLISASLPLLQYVDTQIESWPYSLSPSTKIAIAVLNQLWRNWFALLERGWLVTFWRGSWNYFQIRLSWQTAGSIFILQCKVSNKGCYSFYHASYCMSAIHLYPLGMHIVILHNKRLSLSTQNQIYSQLYKLPLCSWQGTANFFDEEIPCQEQPRE